MPPLPNGLRSQDIARSDDHSTDVVGFFTAGGPISSVLGQFEERPEQIHMARAVHQAMINGRHLAVEAGTGVGKSLAYLIPAIKQTQSGAGRILVSTFTITLQEQLINNDIPLLAGCMGDGFTAALAKGRGNYVCKRRLEFAFRKQQTLFRGADSQLQDLYRWAQQTTDGSLSDLTSVPSPGRLRQVWDAVKSEHGNCRGRKCPHFADCFYWRARRRLDNADIIVANHALMFSDLVLKEQGAAVLPDFRYIIIDEAHNLEHVAEEHFGINISDRRIKFLLDGLFNPRTQRGLLAYARGSRKAGAQNADKAIDMVGKVAAESRIFFTNVRKWFQRAKDETGGRCHKHFVDGKICGYLRDLRAQLAKLARSTKDADEKFELTRFVDRCQLLAEELHCFLVQDRADCVYWVEVPQAVLSARSAAATLRSAPLNVGPDVAGCLFDKYESVILTSATLSTAPYPSSADKGKTPSWPQAGKVPPSGGAIRDTQHARRNTDMGFEFFATRIGLMDSDVADAAQARLCSETGPNQLVSRSDFLRLGSPFDYEKQATIYIEKDLPEPNDSTFIDTAVETLKTYIRKTGGHAFVLFTSYKMLESVAEKLSDWLAEQHIALYQQGAGMDRSVMLRHFRSGRSCLFGTDSFWQGVDVPGEALRNVIIVRLPFAVPDKPLIAGRCEQIRRQGRNPFSDYQLPQAILKFKQGFGRLIRTKNDSGIVVVLDSRIVNKSYGRKFLAAIPKCKIYIVAASKSRT